MASSLTAKGRITRSGIREVLLTFGGADRLHASQRTGEEVLISGAPGAWSAFAAACERWHLQRPGRGS